MKIMLAFFILLGTLSLNADNRYEMMTSEEYDLLILEKIDKLADTLEVLQIQMDRNLNGVNDSLEKLIYVFDHVIYETKSCEESKDPSKAEMIHVTN